MRDSFEKVKIIGLIIGGITNDFSIEIIKGVMNSVRSKSNLKLVILPGELMLQDFMGTEVTQHNIMFNSIYNLGSICNMDGLIISMGSLGWLFKGKEAYSFLDNFKGIPTVLISSDFEDYTTINYDNQMGISEAIDCLVSVYECTQIGMIGGYKENIDAVKRRDIFISCLKENGLEFEEKLYVPSDMSENSEAAAEKLLSDNPDIQAVFCVNDATAVGLYNVMKARNLVPGKDIYVFGFDNTKKSTVMTPPLSSIGPESVALGYRALELLLDKIDGEETKSELVPTRLYGRESMKYDKYDFTVSDISHVDETIINRMFDDCFYRYSTEFVSDDSINLRRLFYEFISRMLIGLKRRYIGIDEFNEIGNLIDIFFENGAMEYTDVHKFLKDVEKLQNGINKQQRGNDNVFVNRLFLRMKDAAIKAISEERIKEFYEDYSSRTYMRRFLIKGMNFSGDREQILRSHISSMNMLGVNNGLFYFFDEPLDKEEIEAEKYPDTILLKGVVKNGEVYLMPEERQRRLLAEIYNQKLSNSRTASIVTFPILYRTKFYGFMLCEVAESVIEHGELISNIMGILVHMTYEI